MAFSGLVGGEKPCSRRTSHSEEPYGTALGGAGQRRGCKAEGCWQPQGWQGPEGNRCEEGLQVAGNRDQRRFGPASDPRKDFGRRGMSGQSSGFGLESGVPASDTGNGEAKVGGGSAPVRTVRAGRDGSPRFAGSSGTG